MTKAGVVLDWGALLELLAGLALSSMGAERCRALAPLEDLERARAALQETAEMAALENSGAGFPMAPFPDLRPVVERAAKGAPLHAVDFRDLSAFLGLVADIIRFVHARRQDAPALAALGQGLQSLAPIKLEIDRCIDGEGQIRESATPELRELTHEAHALKQKMRSRLEALIGSSRFAELLQEPYFAQRENRYVLPIKAERKADVPGIVHDVSASGATVFIEPRDFVDLNNQIKEADLAVEREVRRILQDLTGQIAGHHGALTQDLALLAELDSLRAKAVLSRLLEASTPTLNPEGRIRLKQARHPLLVMSRARIPIGSPADPIVSNDIDMGEGVRVLVISGPNAGGKTVTLKLIGLCALMARAGLPLPCAPGSEMGFFQEVYADIGDSQDLTKDLSSFSAHIRDMITLLREAMPGALVLLDEPVTSTDPAEGAALAQALLLDLARRDFTVVATTHYNALKALAQSHPGFGGASVEFNIATLSPTYRLIPGIPGGSSALDIAGRLGMDEAILEEAARLVNAQERVVEQLMETLQDMRRTLDEDLRRIAALRAEVEAQARLQRESADRQAAMEQETRKGARKRLAEEVLRARATVQSVLDELKSDRRLLKAREAKERLQKAEQQLQARLAPPSDYRPLEELQIGDRVEILSLGAVGSLLEAPAGKKRVRVRVGDAEMTVGTSQLAGLPEATASKELGESPPRRGVVGQGAASSRHTAVGGGESSSVLDVRGKTADEAVEALEAFLDQATVAGTSQVRLVHGHGTGRLRQALRGWLKDSAYVAGFRSGERGEGGDGVTIIRLR